MKMLVLLLELSKLVLQSPILLGKLFDLFLQFLTIGLADKTPQISNFTLIFLDQHRHVHCLVDLRLHLHTFCTICEAQSADGLQLIL
jgi:hypothetical protein